jgi:hypothetical protein
MMNDSSSALFFIFSTLRGTFQINQNIAHNVKFKQPFQGLTRVQEIDL